MRMTDPTTFEAAMTLVDYGDFQGLGELLDANPELANARDEGNATLLIRLIDWPGHRPWASETARVLLTAGAEVDARRDEENGTALSGALCTGEIDVIRVLLEYGADVHAECGWQSGSVLDLADDLCQQLSHVGAEFNQQIAEIFGERAGSPIPSRTPVGGVVPLVFFDDVDAGVEYFTQVLGFRINWIHEPEGSPCGKYVSVQRGDAELHVTDCECDDRRHVGTLYLRICVGPDVAQLYKEFQKAGVTFRSELKDQPWGLREFETEDFEGNRIIFYGDIN